MTAEQEGTAPDENTPDEPVQGPPDEDSPGSNKVLLFLGILAGGAVMIAMVFFAMELPQCEDPVLDWIPCIDA